MTDPGIRAPKRDCPHCPRLVAFRSKNRADFPAFHNGPVASFGGTEAKLLIVGLAPGLKGANRTGRPFTGDYAGDLLYATLLKLRFAKGHYGAEPDDGLELSSTRITNAVRCVPPENKPTGAEVATCRPYLAAEIAGLKRLRAILALGGTAHGSVLSVFEKKLALHPFAHGAEHELAPGVRLFDSYHCSRLNTNTGRLTRAMFERIVERIGAWIGER